MLSKAVVSTVLRRQWPWWAFASQVQLHGVNSGPPWSPSLQWSLISQGFWDQLSSVLYMKGNVTSICGPQEMRTRDLFPKTSFLWICGFPCSSVGKRICQQCRRPWVWSLGWEDPLEKEMATHFSNLAWRIPWTEKPGGLYLVHGVEKSRTRLGD